MTLTSCRSEGNTILLILWLSYFERILIKIRSRWSRRSRQQQKNISSSELENVGHGHRFRESRHLGYYMTNFLSNFCRNAGNVAGDRNATSPLKCRSKSPFAKIDISWQLYDRFWQNCHQNDIIRAGNKSITSADLWKFRSRSYFTKSNISYYRSCFAKYSSRMTT